MAVDQTQVDSYISAASAEDPASKLKNLEEEINLIKTSIKRLLLDLRDRMSEFQSFPQTTTISGDEAISQAPANAEEARKSALEAREAALEAREFQIEATETTSETDRNENASPLKPDQPLESRKTVNERTVSAQTLFGVSTIPQQPPFPEPVSLQKAYRLFIWTQKAVKKFGQDRIEIMLESYRVMGYMPAKSRDEILGIVRLMPMDVGILQEVSAEDYVSEIYTLKRILTPDDTSFERDMIEILMEQRRKDDLTSKMPTGEENVLEYQIVHGQRGISSNRLPDLERTDLLY